jgi:signal transduction histidine kinase
MADQLGARRAWEATTELRRVNRALVMLSACNQALIRAGDETTMAQQISETIVGQGGFRLAWVALAEAESQHRLRILGRAGAATAYLDEIPLDWSEDPSRQGPGATAIRTGVTTVVRDIWTAEVNPEWRRLASKYGFASAVGLPLRRGDRTIGALSSMPAIREHSIRELRLLTELADDLRFGLAALSRNAERQRRRPTSFGWSFHAASSRTSPRDHPATTPGTSSSPTAPPRRCWATAQASSPVATGKIVKSMNMPPPSSVATARPATLTVSKPPLIRKDRRLSRPDQRPTLFRRREAVRSLSVFNDVTTERKYQRRAELQERLAAVGQLAAGIAHDFNNIVGAIILFGEMLLAEKGFSEASRERIRLIVEQAHRAAELTQQILDFDGSQLSNGGRQTCCASCASSSVWSAGHCPSRSRSAWMPAAANTSSTPTPDGCSRPCSI